MSIKNYCTTDSLLPPNSKYKIYEKIGSGAYGEVYKGIRDDDGISVALKRVMITDEDGYNNIPLSTHRELNVLRRLNALGNDNIVRLFDIVLNKIGERMCIDLVFELSEYDLEKYLACFNIGGDMPMSKILNLGQQLMDGVHFMHSYRVLHRDLKPANILIDRHGTNLKITDFGLARILGFDAALTPIAVTLWYRSPEILFKNSYLTACDVWSAGCIIGEMIYGRPLFSAVDELKQLEKIVCRLGYEAINHWPEDSFIDSSSFVNFIDPSRSLDRVLRRADIGLRSLIKSLLRFDPDQRILSSDALTKLKDLKKMLSMGNGVGCTCHGSVVPGRMCSMPDCVSESQDFMVVNSVVRNVLDDDYNDRCDLSSAVDCHPIQGYPHEEVVVVEDDEDVIIEEDDDVSLDESITSESSIEDAEEEIKSAMNDIEEKEADEIGDSFSSYRSQNNESFSSYAPSSQTGVDSSDDEGAEKCVGDELHGLEEFKKGFIISDNEEDDNVEEGVSRGSEATSDTCMGGVSEVDKIIDNEWRVEESGYYEETQDGRGDPQDALETMKTTEEGLDNLSVPNETQNAINRLEDAPEHRSPSPSNVLTQITPFNVATDDSHADCRSPIFGLKRQRSGALHDVNQDLTCVSVSPQSMKYPGMSGARKRVMSVSDDDIVDDRGDAFIDDSENSCPGESVAAQVVAKPVLARHKSLRRRLSVVGAHEATDRRVSSVSVARCASVLVHHPSIGENEEVHNASFGEHSLARALDECQARPGLSDRPKILVRRRSQYQGGH